MEYIIIILFLMIIAFAIVRANKKDFKLEANKLIENLGGIDNLINYEYHVSRFIVTVKNPSKVNKEAIQKMGAQGIVEIENQFKIILGEDSKQLKKYIDEIR